MDPPFPLLPLSPVVIPLTAMQYTAYQSVQSTSQCILYLCVVKTVIWKYDQGIGKRGDFMCPWKGFSSSGSGSIVSSLGSEKKIQSMSLKKPVVTGFRGSLHCWFVILWSVRVLSLPDQIDFGSNGSVIALHKYFLFPLYWEPDRTHEWHRWIRKGIRLSPIRLTTPILH